MSFLHHKLSVPSTYPLVHMHYVFSNTLIVYRTKYVVRILYDCSLITAHAHMACRSKSETRQSNSRFIYKFHYGVTWRRMIVKIARPKWYGCGYNNCPKILLVLNGEDCKLWLFCIIACVSSPKVNLCYWIGPRGVQVIRWRCIT